MSFSTKSVRSCALEQRLEHSDQSPSSGRICLVIPYFEAGDLLRRSLESVQLRNDDLIIVVDDGSHSIPASTTCPSTINGTKVELITLECNRGIAGALNEGIAAIPEGIEYVARLDCGDICSSSRFERQRTFLDQNPLHGIVGSSVSFVDPAGNFLYSLCPPSDDSGIRRYMRVNCALVHPTVVFRRDAYLNAGGYPESFPAAEDYALFREILRSHYAFNLDEILVTCLTSDGGISETSRKQQIRSRIKVMRKYNDLHPMSVYGFIRAYIQVMTPRRFTTWLRTRIDALPWRKTLR